MTAETMRKMKWQFKDGSFESKARVKRKTFGWFDLKIGVACGGMVGVDMRCTDYPELYWAGTFPNYKIAEEHIEKRFAFLDELAAALQAQVQAAEEERKRIIAEAIKKERQGWKET